MLDSVIAGFVSGSSYAILAVALSALYRFTGTLNFGLGATGALGAFSAYSLIAAGLPTLVSVCVGLLSAALVSAATGAVIDRWFHSTGQLVAAIVTAVLFVALLSLGFRLFGDTPRAMPQLFATATFQVFGVTVSSATLVAIALALTIAAAATWLLHSTRVGLQLRAMADRPITAQLSGVHTTALSTGVWVASGLIATIAMLVIAPTRNPTFESLSLLVVPSLAAALVAGFRQLWVAACAGLLIGAIEGAGARIEVISNYRGALPFVIIVVALLWLRRSQVFNEAR